MAWYNANWSHRVTVTIQASQVDADLTDYPLFIDLSLMPDAFWDHVKADGGDLRVTLGDGETECPLELVHINTTAKTGELHTRVSGTTSSVSDTPVMVYFGNAAASAYAPSATYGAQNVWDSHFAGVWHLAEAVNNTAGGYKDSTANGRHLTGVSMSLADGVGRFGGTAPNFDGAVDHLNGNHTINYTSAGWSFSAWANADTLRTVNEEPHFGGNVLVSTGSATIQRLHDITFGYSNAVSYNRPATSLQWDADIPAGERSIIGGGGPLSTGVWYHAAASATFTAHRLYQDGAEVTNNTSYSATSIRSSTNIKVGRFSDIEFNMLTGHFDGLIDEARVSLTARPAAYFAAERRNGATPGTFAAYANDIEANAYTLSPDALALVGGVPACSLVARLVADAVTAALAATVPGLTAMALPNAAAAVLGVPAGQAAILVGVSDAVALAAGSLAPGLVSRARPDAAGVTALPVGPGLRTPFGVDAVGLAAGIAGPRAAAAVAPDPAGILAALAAPAIQARLQAGAVAIVAGLPAAVLPSLNDFDAGVLERWRVAARPVAWDVAGRPYIWLVEPRTR